MSTLTQNERQALNDIFLSMTEKDNFLSKIRGAKMELRYILRLIFKNKKRTKHPLS